MKFQGKSKDNYENSAKAAWYAIVGMIVLLVAMTLFGGCSTTKKVDECCSTTKKVDECCSTTKKVDECCSKKESIK